MDAALIDKIKSQLELLPAALPFLQPVDPLQHGCPDYYDIIKEPMDISSMHPDSIEEFIRNVLLMLGNCYRYNPKGHFIREMAREVGIWFDNCLKENNVDVVIDWNSAGIDDVNNQDDLLDSINEGPSSVVDEFESNTTLIESDEITQVKKSRKRNSVPKQQRRCEICSTNSTPMWRRGPSGTASLCNKCGVKWRSGRKLTYSDGSLVPPPPSDLQPWGKRGSEPLPLEKKLFIARVLSGQELKAPQLMHVLGLIRGSCQVEIDSHSSQIQLDVDQLEDKVLKRIFKYLKKVGVQE